MPWKQGQRGDALNARVPLTLGALATLLAGEPARRLWLPWELPSFNDLERARGTFYQVAPGVRGNGYDVLKQQHQDKVVMFARRLTPVLQPVVPVFRFVEKSRHRDPDGILSAGAKIVLDALGPGRKPGRNGRGGWHGANVIHCDGQHCIAAPPLGVYEVAPRAPGVEVLLFEVRS